MFFNYSAQSFMQQQQGKGEEAEGGRGNDMKYAQIRKKVVNGMKLS